MIITLDFSSLFQLVQDSLFTEVIHIYATADASKEPYPLRRLTAKDSNTKIFTILNYYLPNKKTWSFKWFFTDAFPKLSWLSAMACKDYTKTNGNYVCIGQLKDAIKEYMPHSKHGRYS